MNLPTTKPNDRDLNWYIKECEWMQVELGKLKTENEIMRNRLNSLVSNNNKQTDEYICVDREHGLWKRKEPVAGHASTKGGAAGSDTPRTDELAKREFVPDGLWIKHARELERELNISKKELAAFKKNNEELIQRHNAAISSWDEERELVV